MSEHIPMHTPDARDISLAAIREGIDVISERLYQAYGALSKLVPRSQSAMFHICSSATLMPPR